MGAFLTYSPFSALSQTPNQRTAVKTAIAIIAIVFALIFWKIHNDKEKAADLISSADRQKEARLKEYVIKINRQREANMVKELNATKPLGEAGTAVRTFFNFWKDGKYEELRAMLTAPPNDNHFVDRLRKASLNWRHVDILSEKPDGDGWKVTFNVEVTSPESALAAVTIDEMAAVKNLKGEYAAFSLQPLILGIETFTRLELTWGVAKIDGKMRIDAYPGKDKKGVNLISYVMNDTLPLLRHMGVFQGPGASTNTQEQVRSAMAFWMTFATLELNLDDAASTKLLKDADPLIGQGTANLKLMSEGVVAHRP